MVAAERQGYTVAQTLAVINDRKRKISWKDIGFRHGIKTRLGQKWVKDSASLEALLNSCGGAVKKARKATYGTHIAPCNSRFGPRSSQTDHFSLPTFFLQVFFALLMPAFFA